jgi:hypothetical protein
MEIKKRAGRKPKGTPVQQTEQVIEKPRRIDRR